LPGHLAAISCPLLPDRWQHVDGSAAIASSRQGEKTQPQARRDRWRSPGAGPEPHTRSRTSLWKLLRLGLFLINRSLISHQQREDPAKPRHERLAAARAPGSARGPRRSRAAPEAAERRRSAPSTQQGADGRALGRFSRGDGSAASNPISLLSCPSAVQRGKDPRRIPLSPSWLGKRRQAGLVGRGSRTPWVLRGSLSSSPLPSPRACGELTAPRPASCLLCPRFPGEEGESKAPARRVL